jgi:ribosomal protein L40E
MRVAMKKNFKGKICAYCGSAQAATDDHIFARSLFLEGDRPDLPKAPACRKCNEAKSKLEHYVTAVLPFGGRHPQAGENLLKMVPRRLDKNRRLGQEMARSMRPAMA